MEAFVLAEGKKGPLARKKSIQARPCPEVKAVMPGSGAVAGRFSLAEVVANANNCVPIYWMLLCIAYAVQYRERYREGRVRAAQLETQLVQAQL